MFGDPLVDGRTGATDSHRRPQLGMRVELSGCSLVSENSLKTARSRGVMGTIVQSGVGEGGYWRVNAMGEDQERGITLLGGLRSARRRFAPATRRGSTR